MRGSRGVHATFRNAGAGTLLLKSPAASKSTVVTPLLLSPVLVCLWPAVWLRVRAAWLRNCAACMARGDLPPRWR